MDHTGIVHASSSQLKWLPLEKVKVEVLIVDVNCKVTLIQTYKNPLGTVTGRCKYMFPVPASAAVCAFRMETSDGRIVEGVAKDREVARREYESAIHANQLAGLVNHATDDIFTISVGSIPAQAVVEIYLEYVMNLANDDNADEIRFQLSCGVGQRYGIQPDELISAFRPTGQTRIEITCQVQMAGRIQEIFSPSHGSDISETLYQTNDGRSSRRRTKIDYQSCSFLDRDFVLVISSKDLDSPRCFAELQHMGSQTTLALQISLIPKNFHTIDAQEYLFVIDRSGSMSTGSPRSRINVAKDTLLLLLRMLPTSGTMFNVYIFDDDVESLEPRGLEYNAGNLRKASTYVDGIVSGGGTKLQRAVQHVFQARDLRMPTAVFLLTDGDVYEDGTIQTVKDAVARAPQSAPLRVFTLGIGDGISTATCEGIAIAGNGVCLYATQTESIIGRCARLFRAGRTSILKDVTIDWGIPDEHLSTQSATSSGLLSPAIQQAPTDINNVHSGTQTIVSAIIHLRDNNVPRTVYLCGRLDNNSSPFQPIPIRVGTVHLDGAMKGFPILHTLTAWRLIQEHEAKRGKLPTSIIPGPEDDIRKAVIIDLGERYQLVSRYTSFIAIDSGQDDRRRFHRQATSRDNPRQRSPVAALRHDQEKHSFCFLETTCNMLLGLFGLARNPLLGNSRAIPGSWSTSSSTDNDETADNDDAESNASVGSHKTFSTLSSLDSCDCSDCSVPSSPGLRLRLSPEEEEMQRQPSPTIEPRNLDFDQTPPQRAQSVKPLTPVSPVVLELVRLQDYDGSFSLNSLRSISGIGSVVDVVNKFHVDAKVWATALAIAFMKKEMVDQRALWNDLVAKSHAFLRAATNEGLDEILQHATQVLANLGK